MADSSPIKTGRRRALAVDRFDLIMVSAILTLIVIIGLIIKHGNQLSAQVASGERVVYLASMDGLIENLWIVDLNMANT